MEQLLRRYGWRGEIPDGKYALERAKTEVEMIDKHRIAICTFEEELYPEKLSQCADAPLVFFYKGKLTNEGKHLAVVGTRRASESCCNRVEQIVAGLSQNPCAPVIVSGLAYGIDIAAHKASLKYGAKTYAVLGHGLNTIYPGVHTSIADRIVTEGGALISDFPCISDILPGNFLRRNRIVAGLSDAILVGESALKGGSMTTAHIAASYSRDVMAIPGRPGDKMSEGCNRLIKDNLAALVENAEDVARILDLPYGEMRPQQLTLDMFDPADNEASILKTLHDRNGTNLDELSLTTGVPVNKLTVILLKLELEGRVTLLPGKNYIVN